MNNDNNFDEEMRMVTGHSLAKVLLARVNVLLIELAENDDPRRRSLHDLPDKLDKLKGMGSRLATTGTWRQDGVTDVEMRKVARDFELLSSKKQVMKDIIHLIETLEGSLGVFRSNSNEDE